jgi:hypothetical protein
MGKTKTSECQSVYSRLQLSRLRTRAKAPVSRRTIDFSLGIPADGVVDLSEYQEKGIIPAELIAAVSPVSVIHEDPDQADAYRQEVIANFSEEARGNFAFLPEEFQGGTPEHIILQNSNYIRTVIDRQWEGSDPLDPVANSPINRPLEIVAIEKYVKAAVQPPHPWAEDRGIAHYVFDPLSERWFLVDRWARGEKKKRSQTITPYRQHAAVSRRFHERVEAATARPLKKPEEFATASIAQIEERMKEIRQRRRGRASV